MRVVILFCLLAVFAVGCDPVGFGKVNLKLPAPTGQAPASRSQVAISADRIDVQDALHIIESVVTSGGLVRTQPSQPQPGLLAEYIMPAGSVAPPIVCSVFLNGENLSIRFSEFGRIGPSKETKAMCRTLVDELGGRFGATRVRFSSN